MQSESQARETTDRFEQVTRLRELSADCSTQDTELVLYVSTGMGGRFKERASPETELWTRFHPGYSFITSQRKDGTEDRCQPDRNDNEQENKIGGQSLHQVFRPPICESAELSRS